MEMTFFILEIKELWKIIFLTGIYVGSDNTVLAKVIAEIWKHDKSADDQTHCQHNS